MNNKLKKNQIQIIVSSLLLSCFLIGCGKSANEKISNEVKNDSTKSSEIETKDKIEVKENKETLVLTKEEKLLNEQIEVAGEELERLNEKKKELLVEFLESSPEVREIEAKIEAAESNLFFLMSKSKKAEKF